MDGEMEKLVQAGHNDLRKTGLSPSTIRRVRQSLLDKDFVSIKQVPTYCGGPRLSSVSSASKPR